MPKKSTVNLRSSCHYAWPSQPSDQQMVSSWPVPGAWKQSCGYSFVVFTEFPRWTSSSSGTRCALLLCSLICTDSWKKIRNDCLICSRNSSSIDVFAYQNVSKAGMHLSVYLGWKGYRHDFTHNCTLISWAWLYLTWVNSWRRSYWPTNFSSGYSTVVLEKDTCQFCWRWSTRNWEHPFRRWFSRWAFFFSL